MNYSLLLYTTSTYHNYRDLAGGVYALTSSCNRNSFGSQWLISTDHRSKKTAQPSLPLVFGQGWKINSGFVIVVDEKIKTHVIIGNRPYIRKTLSIIILSTKMTKPKFIFQPWPKTNSKEGFAGFLDNWSSISVYDLVQSLPNRTPSLVAWSSTY